MYLKAPALLEMLNNGSHTKAEARAALLSDFSNYLLLADAGEPSAVEWLMRVRESLRRRGLRLYGDGSKPFKTGPESLATVTVTDSEATPNDEQRNNDEA